ncbi:MAG TPA: TIGR00266 family protein [Spirochaetota bacterium]|nr:TIGR00266 family protein [Spirochaetota bacterium]
MDFKIEHGPVFTVLKVFLNSGETIKAESGAMVSMSTTVELKAKTTGKGVFGAIGAMVGGESLFSSEFTAKAEGEVILCQSTPGDIVHIKMDNGVTVFTQAGAYLAGSSNLNISAQGSLKALMSGEGLFLSKVTANAGAGDLFIGSYGAIMVKELKAGETYIVDTGHIVAFDQSVQYKIKKASKGLFSTFASGEGLVGEYTGPGKIWIQTRNLSSLASAIMPFLPKK